MREPDEHYLSIYGRPVGGGAGRSKPNLTLKREILAKQNGCCLYCGLAFGSYIRRRGRTTQTKVNWDHFIPYSYLYANPQTNWVAACNICNAIKHNKIFETLAEAQRLIGNRRFELGYETVADITS